MKKIITIVFATLFVAGVAQAAINYTVSDDTKDSDDTLKVIQTSETKTVTTETEFDLENSLNNLKPVCDQLQKQIDHWANKVTTHNQYANGSGATKAIVTGTFKLVCPTVPVVKTVEEILSIKEIK